MANSELTTKQKAFVIEFIKNKGNATKAAIKAGYKKETARSVGSENLTKLHIKAEIEKITKKKDDKRVAQAEEVVELLTKFARGQMKEEEIIVEGTGDGCSRASIMKRKIANKDQLSALDKLSRIHGLYNDRVNINSDSIDDLVSVTLGELKGRNVEETPKENE